MLGEGGFGPVYKGNLHQGLEIAVKRFSKSSVQGEEKFKNEVQLIEKLQHKNLIRLLGWCIQEEEKILIYEHMPNNSWDKFLFGMEIVDRRQSHGADGSLLGPFFCCKRSDEMHSCTAIVCSRKPSRSADFVIYCFHARQ
eukprot:TRINITY_DN13541_c0_g1_i11.p1 TRINITY_DN13541_c0_g1~~TRINITY_DN13541_c0_g1_i11.p1  ORF type:complete len:140 (-),score=27.12 TRINITY_DN13541_c0_g1_i11:250-669(-)